MILEKSFIRTGSWKGWLEKSWLTGLCWRKVSIRKDVIRPLLEESWSEKNCLSSLDGRKFVYLAWIREMLV